ncbi:hypothetical protein ACJV2T_03220 [Gardnerella sp. Marseille-Q9179]|uniref:RipA family octameric membrane protein n=1 Tax=Gardnerella sp. Marseille-Q9179 TaxID=3383028 RepID=UPI003AF7EF10
MDDMNHDSNKSEIILAQWRTCVEMANSVSQRRDSMNNIFITLNLAIIAAISISWNIKSIFILLSGIAFCGVWLSFINNYKLLNREKFKVIDSLESQLPAHPFREEWEKLQKVKKYKDGTFLEKVLPITFICIYVLAIVFMIIIKIFIQGGL